MAYSKDPIGYQLVYDAYLIFKPKHPVYYSKFLQLPRIRKLGKVVSYPVKPRRYTIDGLDIYYQAELYKDGHRYLKAKPKDDYLNFGLERLFYSDELYSIKLDSNNKTLKVTLSPLAKRLQHLSWQVKVMPCQWNVTLNNYGISENYPISQHEFNYLLKKHFKGFKSLDNFHPQTGSYQAIPVFL